MRVSAGISPSPELGVPEELFVSTDRGTAIILFTRAGATGRPIDNPDQQHVLVVENSPGKLCR